MLRFIPILLLPAAFAAAGAVEKPVSQRCSEVESAITAKDIAQAREDLLTLERDEPTALCVDALEAKLKSIRTRALMLYKSGSQFESKKDLVVAQRRYRAALLEDPTCADAAAGLARLGTFSEDQFAEARLLSRMGLHQDALTVLKETVKTTRLEAPEDLQYLSGGEVRWWRWIIRRLEPVGRPIGEVIALIVVIVVAISALIVRFAGAPRVEIADFNDDNLITKVGQSVTALLRDQTKHYSDNLLPRLGFIDGPTKAVALPATIATAVPPSLSWLGWVPALIDAFSPRRVITVDGTLHPIGENGAGMTLSLREAGNVLFTSTLWQREFDPLMSVATERDPTGYHELTEPAAIWLLFRVSEAIR